MKRYCSHSGCRTLVLRGKCPAHAAAADKALRALASADTISYDPGIPLPRAVYGRRWAREARAYLAEHPFCVECLAAGNPRGLAEHVDHITPHRGDRALFWDPANRQSLCKMHHSIKTAREVDLGGAAAR